MISVTICTTGDGEVGGGGVADGPGRVAERDEDVLDMMTLVRSLKQCFHFAYNYNTFYVSM